MQIFVSSRKRASITVPCAFAAYLSSVLDASSPPATPPANQTPAPAACARSLRCRGHFAGGLLRTGRSQSLADAHWPRDRLAFSRGAKSHHGPFPQEEARGLQ